MLRSGSERSETDSTTPCTCKASTATVSPIRNQPSKNISRPAITSVRNRCAAKPMMIARNDAPAIVCSRCAPDERHDREEQREREREVPDARLDQRDRGLALADAGDHAGVEVLVGGGAPAAFAAVDEIGGEAGRELAHDSRDREQRDDHDQDRERAPEGRVLAQRVDDRSHPSVPAKVMNLVRACPPNQARAVTSGTGCRSGFRRG